MYEIILINFILVINILTFNNKLKGINRKLFSLSSLYDNSIKNNSSNCYLNKEKVIILSNEIIKKHNEVIISRLQSLIRKKNIISLYTQQRLMSTMSLKIHNILSKFSEIDRELIQKNTESKERNNLLKPNIKFPLYSDEGDY